MSDPRIILHGTELSGHTHRVQLLLRMLGLPYQTQPAPAAVRSSPEFQKLNPLRQIPVLQDGDLTLADSNAILVYLAKRYAPGSQWLPEQPAAAAQVQRRLSVGGIPLDEYASVRSWLRRVEALPKFKPIPPSPLPPQA